MGAVGDELTALLGTDPAVDSWPRLCSLVEGRPEADVVDVELRLRDWPVRLRVMPDRWWAQWRDGDRRPYHRLAAYRQLGDRTTGPDDDPPRTFDNARLQSGGAGLACSSDLRWVLPADNFEAHHNGGEVLLWGTGPDASCRVLVDRRDYHGETHTAIFGRDSATVIAAPMEELVEGRLTAWRTTTGDRNVRGLLPGRPGADHRRTQGRHHGGRLVPRRALNGTTSHLGWSRTAGVYQCRVPDGLIDDGLIDAVGVAPAASERRPAGAARGRLAGRPGA